MHEMELLAQHAVEALNSEVNGSALGTVSSRICIFEYYFYKFPLA